MPRISLEDALVLTNFLNSFTLQGELEGVRERLSKLSEKVPVRLHPGIRWRTDKIPAIKALRLSDPSLDLKGAKKLVEDMEESWVEVEPEFLQWLRKEHHLEQVFSSQAAPLNQWHIRKEDRLVKLPEGVTWSSLSKIHSGYHKIAAIKKLREFTNPTLSLRDAKKRVEDMEDGGYLVSVPDGWVSWVEEKLELRQERDRQGNLLRSWIIQP